MSDAQKIIDALLESDLREFGCAITRMSFDDGEVVYERIDPLIRKAVKDATGM